MGVVFDPPRRRFWARVILSANTKEEMLELLDDAREQLEAISGDIDVAGGSKLGSWSLMFREDPEMTDQIYAYELKRWKESQCEPKSNHQLQLLPSSEQRRFLGS